MHTPDRLHRRLELLCAALPRLQRQLSEARWEQLRTLLASLLYELEHEPTSGSRQRIEQQLDVLMKELGLERLPDDPGLEEPFEGGPPLHRPLSFSETGQSDDVQWRGHGRRSFPLGVTLGHGSKLGGFIRLLEHLRGYVSEPAVRPLHTRPEVRTPDEVVVKTRFRVEVTALFPGDAPDSRAMAIPRSRPGPVDLEVELRLPPGRGLEAVGALTAPLRVMENQDSATVTFEVRAVEVGHHRLQVAFRQDGIELFALPCQVLVSEPRPEAPASTPKTRTAPPVFLRTGPTPCLVLSSSLTGVTATHRHLRLRLHGPPLLMPRPEDGFIELPVHTEGLMTQLCRDMEGLYTHRDAATREHRLRGIGADLASALLPANIRSMLSASSRAGTPLHIESESDEAWVPWELVWLGSLESGFFLGERFAVSRWLRQGILREELAHAPALMVAPTDSGLDVNDEIEALEQLAGAPPQELRLVYEVQRRLSSGERLGVVHFACHGRAPGSEPLGPHLVLQEDELLRPPDVPALASAERTAPLEAATVFLNACQTGLPGYHLWGHGSWADRFLLAGAAAVIAASWATVSDKAATFATAFYKESRAGVPLAEAARLARVAVRSSGDPNGLAYAVYAGPGARFTARRPSRS